MSVHVPYTQSVNHGLPSLYSMEDVLCHRTWLYTHKQCAMHLGYTFPWHKNLVGNYVIKGDFKVIDRIILSIGVRDQLRSGGGGGEGRENEPMLEHGHLKILGGCSPIFLRSSPEFDVYKFCPNYTA